MAASAGHAVAYTIGSIFKHIIDCVQLYFTNGIVNPLKRQLSLAYRGVTLIFDGTPQIIVQRCSAADNAIFKNRTQNIECSFGCVPRSAVLLKANVANILLFNFWDQKLVQHGRITIAINCNGLSLLIFKEKLPNYTSKLRSAPNK